MIAPAGPSGPAALSREAARMLGSAETDVSQIDPQTMRAVRAFLASIPTHIDVREVWLFGSRARGDHAPDSDADVAIVLPGRRADLFAVVQALSSASFDALLATDIRVSPLPLWEEELRRPETYPNPALLENIRRQGLAL